MEAASFLDFPSAIVPSVFPFTFQALNNTETFITLRFLSNMTRLPLFYEKCLRECEKKMKAKGRKIWVLDFFRA